MPKQQTLERANLEIGEVMETKNVEDGRNLVRKLIAGSQAIDRMRQEINLVVKLVLGLVTEHAFFMEFRSGTLKIQHPTLHLAWLVRTCHSGLYGQLWISPGRLDEFYSSLVPNRLSMGNVETVHSALPFFVLGMLRTFPALKEGLRPLLDATDTEEGPATAD